MHSPTPWNLVRSGGLISDTIRDAESRVIGTVVTRKMVGKYHLPISLRDNEQGQANMRLMLAAPKLKDVLVNMLEAMEENDREQGHEHMYECPGIDSCVICQAREVLAEVEGTTDEAEEL